jgi:hypothetical protein
VVAEWCILDVLEEAGGSLKRIFTPAALPDTWQITPIPAEQTDSTPVFLSLTPPRSACMRIKRVAI